jgi:DNA-binding NarL/FixJ family response regulator
MKPVTRGEALTAPIPVTVAGGDAHTRHRIAAQLGEAGFAPAQAGAVPPCGGLIVVICRGTDAARVREVRELANAHPQARILAIMPTDAPNASLRRVLLAGATGIILDVDVDRALVPTARAMLAGQLAVPTVLSRQIAPQPLSHREKQILAMVVLGFTNREIANKLFLAESTVKTHLSSAFRKIDARSRSEAVDRIQDPESGYGMAILAIADDVAAPAA